MLDKLYRIYDIEGSKFTGLRNLLVYLIKVSNSDYGYYFNKSGLSALIETKSDVFTSIAERWDNGPRDFYRVLALFKSPFTLNVESQYIYTHIIESYINRTNLQALEKDSSDSAPHFKDAAVRSNALQRESGFAIINLIKSGLANESPAFRKLINAEERLTKFSSDKADNQRDSTLDSIIEDVKSSAASIFKAF